MGREQVGADLLAHAGQRALGAGGERGGGVQLQAQIARGEVVLARAASPGWGARAG